MWIEWRKILFKKLNKKLNWNREKNFIEWFICIQAFQLWTVCIASESEIILNIVTSSREITCFFCMLPSWEKGQTGNHVMRRFLWKSHFSFQFYFIPFYCFVVYLIFWFLTKILTYVSTYVRCKKVEPCEWVQSF